MAFYVEKGSLYYENQCIDDFIYFFICKLQHWQICIMMNVLSIWHRSHTLPSVVLDGDRWRLLRKQKSLCRGNVRCSHWCVVTAELEEFSVIALGNGTTPMKSRRVMLTATLTRSHGKQKCMNICVDVWKTKPAFSSDCREMTDDQKPLHYFSFKHKCMFDAF